MGMADAGTAMTLHSAAPATILIATAFMGHLLLCGAGSVHDPARPDHSLTRHNLNPQALRWFPSDSRASGWQPVGNWVPSAANFPASLLPVGVIPTTSRESRRKVCVGKWPEAQAEQVASVHVFSSQEGAETIPSGGVFFCAKATC